MTDVRPAQETVLARCVPVGAYIDCEGLWLQVTGVRVHSGRAWIYVVEDYGVPLSFDPDVMVNVCHAYPPED